MKPKLQQPNLNFSEKSDDEKRLIAFTRAVNQQSDNLKKADMVQLVKQATKPAAA